MRYLLTLILAASLLGVAIAPIAAADPAVPEQKTVEEKQAKQASYWLGVMCHPVSETLRAQLNVPEGQGLVVAQVVPEGPAAKAGIRKHDILLAADEKFLDDVGTLADYVDQHGSDAIKIQFLRGGKAQLVEVTPAERPADVLGAIALPGGDRRALRDWIERMDPNVELGPVRQRRFRLRFLHPGLMLEGRRADADWPADMSVAITREGNEPMKITVRRGDQSWEISRDELAKLPDQVRPLIAELIGDVPQDGGEDIEIELPQIEFGEPLVPGVELPEIEIPAPGAPQRELEDRLREIQEQLEQLQRELIIQKEDKQPEKD